MGNIRKFHILEMLNQKMLMLLFVLFIIISISTNGTGHILFSDSEKLMELNSLCYSEELQKELRVTIISDIITDTTKLEIKDANLVVNNHIIAPIGPPAL